MLRRVLRERLLAILAVQAALEQNVREPVLLLGHLVEGRGLFLGLDEQLPRIAERVDFERAP